MKRNESLISFSHDHHHALAEARRLSRAAEAGGVDRLRAARAFLEFFEREALAHFRDEEQLLFPCAYSSDDRELHDAVARAVTEHTIILEHVSRWRSATDIERAPTSEQFSVLGLLFTAHVRFEERVVFDLLQRHVAERDLAQHVGDRATLDRADADHEDVR